MTIQRSHSKAEKVRCNILIHPKSGIARENNKKNWDRMKLYECRKSTQLYWEGFKAFLFVTKRDGFKRKKCGWFRARRLSRPGRGLLRRLRWTDRYRVWFCCCPSSRQFELEWQRTGLGWLEALWDCSVHRVNAFTVHRDDRHVYDAEASVLLILFYFIEINRQ